MPHFVLHIPHASTVIPAPHRARLLLSDEALQHEAKRMADLHTDELFAVEASLAQSVVFHISRCVVDPERFVDKEPMADVGMGVIYERTSTGDRLRHPPSPEERQALLDEYYSPHHTRLTHAVDDTLTAHGRCILLDCHSFPSERRPYDQEETPGPYADICLGTEGIHTPPWLVELAKQAFESAGWSVALNCPFKGSLVPLKHWGKNPKVLSLMVEINRRLYLDANLEKSADFDAFKAKFQRVLRQFMLKAQATRLAAG